MIVAGLGFRRGTTVADLRAALAGRGRLDALATVADKAPALAELAAELGLPLVAVPADLLAAQPVLTQGKASLRARGVGSVAEGAALAAAGPGARLLGPRIIWNNRITLALALGLGAGKDGT
ncbi:cobalamin biosynthesis protein (plasmid) [Paracoccus yeei]|uniref:cobalamin biosynthesis protein n=1 Tax=Paracoccus yeei TaxID=147645 RepID=UPI003BF846F7